MRPHARAGFTFVEVVCCLLVLSLGIAGAVGMAMYALVVGDRAQGQATGMATALSVAVDPAPLLAPGTTSWKLSAPSGLGRTTGWINGFYVVRIESAGAVPSGTGGAAPPFTSNPVSVDVYDGLQGHLVASYTTWVLRQDLVQ